MGRPFSPKNLPLPMGGSEPPSNTWSLGPTRVLNPNGISISSPVFAGLTSVTDRPWPTDRHTDHATRSMTIDCIYVRSTAMRPNNSEIHTVPISVNGEVDWGNDIIKNAHHKTQYTKWNKLCHDESLLNINTARWFDTLCCWLLQLILSVLAPDFVIAAIHVHCRLIFLNVYAIVIVYACTRAHL